MEYTIEHGDDTFDLVFSGKTRGRRILPNREYPGEEPETEIEIEEVGKNGGDMVGYDKNHPDYPLIEELLNADNGKHYSAMEQIYIDSCSDDSDDDDRRERSVYRLRR